MLTNYIKLILRNFKRQKLYAFINILGLAVGLAGSMLILVYINHELSYDRFHTKSDRIYRVTQKANFPNGYNHHFARCSINWINNLVDEFPEIEALIRFQHDPITDIRIKDQVFRDRHSFRTDKNVFDVFSFRLLQGNPATVLENPYSVVLTATMAEKYFGSVNPLGRKIDFMPEGSGEYSSYLVTGIMEDVPDNAHFKINFLKSFRNEEERSGWAYVYLLLTKNTDIRALSEKFPEFIDKYTEEGNSQYFSLVLQNIRDIHLHSHLAREMDINGNMLYIYLFIAVAIFLIIIAAINFMNLSTARSLERAKEVGMRKVLGSQRHQLITYFYSEAFVYTTVAFCFAFIITIIVFPYFNNFTGKSLILFDATILTGFFLISIITALFSGSYPAMVLSHFQPLTALKGDNTFVKMPGNISLRRGLVVIQLIISVTLIISTIITWQQFTFLSNKNLGLNTEQVLAIRNISEEVKSNYHVFKSELNQITGILGISASMEEPSREIRDTGEIFAEGMQEGDNTFVMDIQCIDENYIDFMEIELLTGSNFPSSLAANYQYPITDNRQEAYDFINRQPRAYLLNEAAVNLIGWKSVEEALHKQFSWSNSVLTLQRGPVVGVVKNFHQESLRNRIDPIVFIYEPYFVQTILIRIHTGNVNKILSEIESTWKDIYPQSAFEYVFVDDLYANLYLSEKKQAQILSIFALITIFIAFMGIFGLTAYETERRRKEVGIRKVLGASTASLLYLLGREFLGYVLIAGFIAGPLAWYILSSWLQNFAYHIEIRWYVFLGALILVLITVILTVVREQ